MAQWQTSSCRTSRNRSKPGIPRRSKTSVNQLVQRSRATHIDVRRLGLMSYADALALQRTLVEDRRAARVGDQLLFVEHPHVLTLGVRGDGGRGHILASEEALSSLGVEVHETGRGG